MAATYGLLSTYPPIRCGLASCNGTLATQLTTAGRSGGVVRVTAMAAWLSRPRAPTLRRPAVAARSETLTAGLIATSNAGAPSAGFRA